MENYHKSLLEAGDGLPERAVTVGLTLNSVVVKANAAIGHLITVQYSVDLVGATCYAFYATGLPGALSAMDPSKICNGLGYALFMVAAFLRMWTLQKAGQSFCDLYQVSASYIRLVSE